MLFLMIGSFTCLCFCMFNGSIYKKNETRRETYIIRKQNKIEIKEKKQKKSSAKDNTRKNIKKPKCISHGFVKAQIVSYQIIGKKN